MSHRLILRNEGFVVLAIVAKQFPIFGIPPLLDEKTGHIKIGLISRHPVQFYKPDFNFLMSGYRILPARAEHAANQVGILYCHLEKSAFARGQKMGYGRLIHMPDVIKFMGDPDIFPSFFAHHGRRVFGVDSAGGIQIAVIFLGGGKKGYQFVQILVQRGIRLQCQCVGCPFHNLKHIGIVEKNALMLSFHEASRFGKITDAPRLF
ncbi:MAG: hypothetical protein BWY09_00818 [Candidatus Hydrogenedentes bacterium ADurb.Bin179]|nr:MAG: hypothetical protein BWY09_00818 [Candidatus Hydrogenedentes bacterium ADurb.Bin179]